MKILHLTFYSPNEASSKFVLRALDKFKHFCIYIISSVHVANF